MRGLKTKLQLLVQRNCHALHVGAGHSPSCHRDQCCHAGRQLLSTCSYAAATAASCCSLAGPTAVGWDQESPGPWRRIRPIRGPESHGRWQCPPLQMSPLDRGVDRERPRRRAGSRPCGLSRPAASLSLLPILGEPAQSWSNLRDSQSVVVMADPPTAPARDPQPAPAAPQQQLSPLSGAYLLIVVGEPFSEEHKKLILQKLQQGKLK